MIKKIKQRYKVFIIKQKINKILLDYEMLLVFIKLIENNIGHLLGFKTMLFFIDLTVVWIMIDHQVKLLQIHIAYVLSIRAYHFEEKIDFLFQIIIQHEQHVVNELLEVNASVMVKIKYLKDPVGHLDVWIHI